MDCDETNGAIKPDGEPAVFDTSRPLALPEDEAIAQYLAMPKSLREFKSFTQLAEHFNISRMTAYRRRKDFRILHRADWLLRHCKLAGDLVARLHWGELWPAKSKPRSPATPKLLNFAKKSRGRRTKLWFFRPWILQTGRV